MPDPAPTADHLPQHDPDGTTPDEPRPSTDVGGSTPAARAASAGDLPAVPGYAVLGEIARGGMGRVLAARDLALDREVAVKVLLAAGPDPAAARRFVRESKITARLPHPGVPPVYALGELPVGGPFLAMKLIRGRTLADLLKDRRTPTDDQARFVQAFEQVCQTVGFAHSVGVVHRDLKPANVMVGAFGEVQVMDWGLAREAGDGRDRVAAVHGGTADATAAGAVFGTPAYMPPEQARGQTADARSDVFALGGVLCAILTGRPPYTGATARAVLTRAAEADLDEAFSRLDTCGADAELVALCKRCLAPNPAVRPADGKAVADAVAAHRAGVEDRLRRAERERAAAQAATIEQRKKRRVQLALAAALGVLVVGGGAVGWWQQDQATRRRLETANRLARNGDATAAQLDRCQDALAAENSPAAAAALEQATRQAQEGGAEHLAARFDRCRTELTMLRELDRIDDLRWQEAEGDRPPRVLSLEAWAACFRDFGIVPGVTPPADVARRLNDSPLRDRLLAALDQWLAWSRSADLLTVLREVDPDSFRNAVRVAIVGGQADRVRELAGQPAALQQPARFAVVLGGHEAVPTDRAERLLGVAWDRKPGDFGLLMTLGSHGPIVLSGETRDREKWLRAAVAVRPWSTAGYNNLAVALSQKQDYDGSLAACEAGLRIDDSSAYLHANRALCLYRKGLPREAVEGFRKSLGINPTVITAHVNLGAALADLGDLGGAAAAVRAALAINPKYLPAWNNLAAVLRSQGDWDGAIAACDEAIRIDPTFAPVHHNRALALADKGDTDGAVASYRTALKYNPTDAESNNNLGAILALKGDVRGAVGCYQAAIRARPNYPEAHNNLGLVFAAQGSFDDAIACFRAAIRAAPGFAEAHANLGAGLAQKKDYDGAIVALRDAIRHDPKHVQAYANLGSILQGKGDLDGAVAACREAIRIEPRFAPAHNNLGAALAAKGDLDGAVAAFREAVRLDPTNPRYRKFLELGLQLKAERDARADRVAPPPREVKR